MAKEGRHYRFKHLEFWAASGMVCFVDERFPPSSDKAFKVDMVREFLTRLYMMSQEIKEMPYADERNEMQNFIDDGIKVCKEAKSQGRPDDPKAVADMHRTKHRYTLYAGTGDLLISGNVNSGYENLPAIPTAPESKPMTPLVRPDSTRHRRNNKS